MRQRANAEFDVAVIGGGLVGCALALGLARLGKRVGVLDEGDAAPRASRANFALVWVQSKGLGMPAYAGWTLRSADAWAAFAAGLREESGVDVAFARPGGFHLALSEEELATRVEALRRLHNQPGVAHFTTEILEASALARRLPHLGPEVVGGSYCPLDGHCNSLKLYRALNLCLAARGVVFLSGWRVADARHDNGAFRLTTAAGEVTSGAVVIAAGNASMQLAPMLGMRAPMRPNRGQVIVTERVAPFLTYPISNIRQTDEGTVMIGDSQLEGADPNELSLTVCARMADRARRCFPPLARLNVVRMWSGIRVMTADGFPIYDQSERYPGAFVVCCHSGVTLAANHALTLAPMIAGGRLDAEAVGAFSARRFDVHKAA
jgi:glycine/D-amino acid oxidase-like deaminating enzyme